jgi:uncharacterized protein YegJ (DUF2314 family)
MSWWKKEITCAGSVLYRGSMPPRAEEFSALKACGISINPKASMHSAHWELELSHEKWGRGRLTCLRDVPPPPEILIDHSQLTQDEADLAKQGRSLVSFALDSSASVLRGRKNLLYFSNAIMGNDGLCVMDHNSQRFWAKDALNDELAHDADVDVEALYSMHLVADDETCPKWLHTHGLSSIGGIDFDILDAHEDVTGTGRDLLRALAYAILEKNLDLSTPSFSIARPGGAIRLVDASTFNRKVDRALRERLRPDDDDHLEDRGIVCEAAGGFLQRWFGKIRPSSFFSNELPNEILISFSTAASDLMASRAKNTYQVFRALVEEFSEFPFPMLVKLGYVVDDGEDDDKEHLWFEVKSAGDSEIDAVLINEPFNIDRMKDGDQGMHPIDLISDWTIMTPAGHITPRSLMPARLIRKSKDELRAILKKEKEEEN